MGIEYLIHFENENTALESKSTRYTKSEHECSLKDRLALTTATAEGPRHIIIGVKRFPGGKRNLGGSPEGVFVDPAKPPWVPWRPWRWRPSSAQ